MELKCSHCLNGKKTNVVFGLTTVDLKALLVVLDPPNDELIRCDSAVEAAKIWGRAVQHMKLPSSLNAA